MASSRKVGTNEEIATYGTGKTYTSLATWEADTDIDLVTATKSCVLEVYGNSYNDGNCVLGGPDGDTDASYFRIIRPASGNKLTSGAISTKHFIFASDSSQRIISVAEDYAEVQDIVATRTSNLDTSTTTSAFYGGAATAKFVGCVAIDCVNTYSGRYVSGFYLSSANPINCLSHNNDGIGFYGKAFNCTATNNGLWGFTAFTTSTHAYGCGADGNGSGDLDSGHLTLHNCSDSTPTFAAGTDNFHLDSTDTTWKDADDNTDDWHSACGYDDDIDGNTRTGSWDIGWHELAAADGSSAVVENDLWNKVWEAYVVIEEFGGGGDKFGVVKDVQEGYISVNGVWEKWWPPPV